MKRKTKSGASYWPFLLLIALLIVFVFSTFLSQPLTSYAASPSFNLYKYICEVKPGFKYQTHQPRFLTNREFNCEKSSANPQPKGTCTHGGSCSL